MSETSKQRGPRFLPQAIHRFPVSPRTPRGKGRGLRRRSFLLGSFNPAKPSTRTSAIGYSLTQLTCPLKRINPNGITNQPGLVLVFVDQDQLEKSVQAPESLQSVSPVYIKGGLGVRSTRLPVREKYPFKEHGLFWAGGLGRQNTAATQPKGSNRLELIEYDRRGVSSKKVDAGLPSVFFQAVGSDSSTPLDHDSRADGQKRPATTSNLNRNGLRAQRGLACRKHELKAQRHPASPWRVPSLMLRFLSNKNPSLEITWTTKTGSVNSAENRPSKTIWPWSA